MSDQGRRTHNWFEKTHEKGYLLLSRARQPRPALFVSFLILMIMLAGTTILWQQAWNRVSSDSEGRAVQVLSNVDMTLQSRINLYVDILAGTKGLFEAEGHVDRAEFENYFSSIQIKQKYAGFSAILYVAKVNAADKDSFVASARADATLPSDSRPNYTIYPTATKDVYYPVLYTYKGSSPLTITGYDLGTNPTRVAQLEATGTTNTLSLSDTQNLNSSDPTQKVVRPGFSMTVPVYSDGHYVVGDQPVGFLVATFEHKLILANLMSSDGSGALLRVYDRPIGGSQIYEQGDESVLKNTHRTQETTYDVGGKTWRLELYTLPTFGVSSPDQALPRVIGVSGLIITALLLAYFLSGSDLSRRRRP